MALDTRIKSLTEAIRYKLNGLTTLIDSKVASISAVAPLATTGGANPVLSISTATTSAAGSMSAVDKTKLNALATPDAANTWSGAQTFTAPGGVLISRFGDDASAAMVTMQKARGTATSPTAVIQGDALANFQGWGFDGSAYRRGGNFRFVAAAPVVNGQSIVTDLHVLLNNGSTNAQVLTLTSAGNLTITGELTSATLRAGSGQFSNGLTSYGATKLDTVSVAYALTVQGVGSYFNNDLTVYGALKASGGLIVQGNISSTGLNINYAAAEGVKLQGNGPILLQPGGGSVVAYGQLSASNLSGINTGDQTISVAGPLTSTGGLNPTLSINPATTSAAGSMSAADKVKLNGPLASNVLTINTYNLPSSSPNVILDPYLLGSILDIVADHAVIVTIPDDGTAFEIGSKIVIRQGGTGAVSLNAASGVTLQTAGGLKIKGRYSAVEVVKLAANTWWAVGALVS
jgi:hypothetical protein